MGGWMCDVCGFVSVWQQDELAGCVALRPYSFLCFFLSCKVLQQKSKPFLSTGQSTVQKRRLETDRQTVSERERELVPFSFLLSVFRRKSLDGN
mmetsp:Transcript_27055/g.53087  ORF Transcript_27055/g.53087 Transcript_27055/m.53087 type:complete len:94 (+) Transcript_27055:2062-2343(+)